MCVLSSAGLGVTLQLWAELMACVGPPECRTAYHFYNAQFSGEITSPFDDPGPPILSFR